jgi:hypothetical protein
MLELRMRDFDTTPGVVHAQGYHRHKPLLDAIQRAHSATNYQSADPPRELTILTCNNGHPSMGGLERSLARMGLSCRVCGQGMKPWVNSIHKPRALAGALQGIDTEYTLYADSRDAFLIKYPSSILQTFSHFSCDLLFGGDRLSYPPDPVCTSYEDARPGAAATEFKYLNAGAWIGKTHFARSFFQAAAQNRPLDLAPQSEQGILRKILPLFAASVAIDYRCEIFLNIGFVFDPNTVVIEQLSEQNEIPNHCKTT